MTGQLHKLAVKNLTVKVLKSHHEREGGYLKIQKTDRKSRRKALMLHDGLIGVGHPMTVH